ncbi:uracil-DNA glycosylase [Rhodococcus sp. Eu-32]|uniref:uracil-DNA glycosylase n=1 Tax=Rhodococcus sp. Eu-32 TaxID=1017319 RepID=UPI001402346F|nr:uracil-DNA glycosylase [Rhodococcus sp. Eu-32]
MREISSDVDSPNLPYNDPMFGGVEAELLIVMKAPEADAAPDKTGTRFLCFDNADAGAANIFEAFRRNDIARSRCIAWNICPFPIQGNSPTASELRQARPYTQKLIDLLPRLKVVLLLGRPAADGWDRSLLRGRAGISVLTGASPSPPGISSPRNRESFESAIREAATILESKPVVNGPWGHHGGAATLA